MEWQMKLQEKGLSMYRLSQVSGVPKTTVIEIMLAKMIQAPAA